MKSPTEPESTNWSIWSRRRGRRVGYLRSWAVRRVDCQGWRAGGGSSRSNFLLPRRYATEQLQLGADDARRCGKKGDGRRRPNWRRGQARAWQPAVDFGFLDKLLDVGTDLEHGNSLTFTTNHTKMFFEGALIAINHSNFEPIALSRNLTWPEIPLSQISRTFFLTSKKYIRVMYISHIPSGGLTLIVGTQKWGFSCKVQRRSHADIFLNESLPPKTPCGHHVHGRHGHGSPVKNRWRFSKFRKKYETLTITL